MMAVAIPAPAIRPAGKPGVTQPIDRQNGLPYMRNMTAKTPNSSTYPNVCAGNMNSAPSAFQRNTQNTALTTPKPNSSIGSAAPANTSRSTYDQNASRGGSGTGAGSTGGAGGRSGGSCGSSVMNASQSGRRLATAASIHDVR